MEMTMRTPYKTLFKNFSGFEHLYVQTPGGHTAIVNGAPPAVHLLPAGEVELINMTEGDGNHTTS